MKKNYACKTYFITTISKNLIFIDEHTSNFPNKSYNHGKKVDLLTLGLVFFLVITLNFLLALKIGDR